MKMMHAIWAVGLLLPGAAPAQHPPGQQGSRNIAVQAHIPRGGRHMTGDIEIEQELSRPFVYVSSRKEQAGFDIITVKDPQKAEVIYRWRIDNPELHLGGGGMDGKYFKRRNRYYYVQSLQFDQNGPDATLGAVVADVTSLPDTSRVRIVRRILAAENPGGFHNIFAYRHSDGRALLFATSGPQAKIYDLDKLLAGDTAHGLVGKVPVPQEGNTGTPRGGYHDFYIGYDPASRQDRFYGPGTGGFHIFDVTRPEDPRHLFSIQGSGIDYAHTFTPTPDGRYAVTEVEYQYAPLRIYDLKPGFDGETRTITRPVGAWTADWQNLSHNHEVRWPYVFVSAYEDGLQVFNMMDPTNPYTVGYYDTHDGPHNFSKETEVYLRPQNAPSSSYAGNWGVIQGAWGVDIRNADGLIVISDMITGFWALRMEGFDGWNGHQWGMPNISSAQDWDNGPDGASAPRRIS